MKLINVVIVVHDVVLAESLTKMVRDLDFQVNQVYHSYEAATEQILTLQPTVVVSEITAGLPERNMVEAIKLATKAKAPFIFITNSKDIFFRKTAIGSANAIYFLKKPVVSLELETALEIAERNYAAIRTQINDLEQQRQGHLFVRDGPGFKKISIQDIAFLKADGSYTSLATRSQTFLFSDHLSTLEAKLSFSPDIVRVHRSYLININHVEKVQENRLWVGHEEIPIGKTYRNVVRDRIIVL